MGSRRRGTVDRGHPIETRATATKKVAGFGAAALCEIAWRLPGAGSKGRILRRSASSS